MRGERGSESDSTGVEHKRTDWGGITLIMFDKSGKITAEIGEESTPGPMERYSTGVLSLPASESKESETNTNFKREVTGTFSPSGPARGRPNRTEAGGYCIVDLKQDYNVTGHLSGNFEIDFSILVHGPCEVPSTPGKYDEEWIAYGTFSGTVESQPVNCKLSYLANVKAGEDVEGRMNFSGELNGTLSVSGNFTLSYNGLIE